jgi:GT2 family glycosyltransferase
MIPSISVIIPSYNGIELLSENLPYVLKSLENIDQFEIIVIDDASSDDSDVYLKDNFPKIQVIRNTKNLGFIRSVNKGLHKANFDLVLLLNNDIKPDKNYISSSIRYFEESNTFGVMGIIKDEISEEILEGIKYPKISISGLTYKDIRDKKIEHYSGKILTYYLCGGNAIIERKKMLELNGLSEIYEPFYQEDVDMSVRAWLSGWKSYVNINAICYHKHSATIKKYYKTEFIKNVSKRNRLILSYIYLQGIQWQVFNVITVIKSIYYGFLHIIKFQSVYPGYQEFFRQKKKLRNYRLAKYAIPDFNQLIQGIQKNIKETGRNL